MYYLLLTTTTDLVPVLPTPLLVEQGSRRWVEAYQEHPATDRYPPIWRMRDDSYDPPGIEYEMVRIVWKEHN